jgi:FtsH-binding integral membrane protein
MIALAASAVALFALHVLTPFWWWVALVPLAYGFFFAKEDKRAFWEGFLLGAVVWGGAAAFFFLTSGRLIASRMAGMFRLGKGWLILALTALLGGLVAGLASFAGRSLRFKK